MAKKPARTIELEEGITFGDVTFKPGDESALAQSGIPQWNLNQMASKGWISGDWSNIGATPEEEAAAVEEVQAAAATAPAARKSRR